MAEGVEDDRISGEGDESCGKRWAAPIGRERIAGLGDDPGAQEAGGVGEGRGRRLRRGRESAGIDLQSSGGSLSEQQPERGAAEAEVEAGRDTGGGADLHHDARAPHAEEATGNPSGGGGGGGGGMRVEDVAGVGLVVMPVLPERARQLIMSFLPLRMAIRMSTVSKPWLRTWMENRQYLKYLFTSSKQIEPIRQELDRRGIRRLHSFSVSVRCSQLNQEDFGSLLRYAAQCSVQNLAVDLLLKRKAYYFQLPEMRPGLVRLSLRRVGITRLQQAQACSIPTLEHLEIMGAALDDQTLQRLILGCPHLRLLDLQRCTLMRRIDFNGARNDLRRLIVAECPSLRIINAPTANCLISFTYSGDFSELAFSPSAELSNLYICFGGPPFARTLKPSHKWISLMCNLSLLKVLTICSVALEVREEVKPELSMNFFSLAMLPFMLFSMPLIILSHLYYVVPMQPILCLHS